MEALKYVLYKLGMDPHVVIAFIAIGVLFDLANFVVDIRSARRGHGASPVDVIPWVLYVMLVVFSRKPVPIDIGDGIWCSLLSRLLSLLALAAFSGTLLMIRVLCWRRNRKQVL